MAVISSKGNGVSGLINGEGDMALQLESEILDHKEVELAGSLPDELKAYNRYVGGDLGQGGRSRRCKSLHAFVTRRQAAALWKAKGLDR